MGHRSNLLLLIGLLVLVACGSDPAKPPAGCDEFNAPPSRAAAPTECPAKPVTATPYKPQRYCYRTLGQIDCFAEPQPGHPGYIGAGG